ncbi:MAG: type I restriction endonuclease subunit R [Thiothrix sp.]|nr:MAG: type I restriction endonuclease subunit R [Thiothrix sp.]
MFTEARLEQAIIQHLGEQGYPHFHGARLQRDKSEVLIKDDLRAFLQTQYQTAQITASEIEAIIRQLEGYSALDLYDSNKAIMRLVADGFLLKREDPKQKDLYIQLLDYRELEPQREPKAGDVPRLIAEGKTAYLPTNNRYKLISQLEIIGQETRIPDAILYINGLPLVLFEFKSAIRENATIHDAYVQLTTRYRRDIPELLKYNALCIISDGVNNKMGSAFAPYEFFYAWRKITGDETVEKDGIDSLYTLIQGLFQPKRLLEVIRHFIYFPNKSHREEKVVCRYPQYYAATKLFENIKQHRKPHGDGKGGTYFGATGCGKSYTMLFLTRLLMKSVEFASPTIILITDRTDLDDQLSEQFVKAKDYIGDETVVSVESRSQLRELLKGRSSGGVFLTTIHKFTEDLELLTDRSNVICISDEAHRSQVNLDQKITVNDKGVKRTYGFAKYLHDSLPNATFVGFTGTPIDATLDVFGRVVDAYTMTESVQDEITVRIVYEGRAAKVLLDNRKLEEIEKYYEQCAEQGTNDYQIEESKKASATMSAILGDPKRLQALAEDFVAHYENRIHEGATLKGKALFVCSKREIAWAFYQRVIALRPEWAEAKVCAEGETLSEQDQKDFKAIERIKLVMTRGKDDEKALYDMLGTKDYRKDLDRQFKNPKSNFKIAIVVDMWLTGFDVPFLDTIYIDKPIQRHSLIQTISRVNRKFEGKEKGLVVDYIGIKSQMNVALKQYSKSDESNVEEVQQSIIVVKDHLDLLAKIFHEFDSHAYFHGSPVEQLDCLNRAVEFIQRSEKLEQRFMALVKRLKAAYDICVGTDAFTPVERDTLHFYLAVRSLLAKLTKGDAPDTAQMNAKVRDLIQQALESEGVEEIIRLGEEPSTEVDIFSEHYLNIIDKIKLPHTKIKLLQKLLNRAISDFKKTNKLKGMDFSERFKKLVDQYNERREENVLDSSMLTEFAEDLMGLLEALQVEKASFEDMGLDFEAKAFYDILKSLTVKYDFTYPEEKLLELAKAVKAVVDDKASYVDWSQREDIKAELKVDLIMLLYKHGYPPVDKDEVYKEIFEQAENFKKYRST